MTLLISTLLVGQLVAVVVWLFLQLLTRNRNHDTAHRDPPALGFRLLGIFIEPIVHYLGHWMPAHYVHVVQQRLGQAGVEYSLDARQFVAAKCVSLCTFLSIAASLLWLTRTEVWVLAILAGLLGWCYPDIWLARHIKTRRTMILNALPFYLDIITLSVESGSNLTSGLMQAIRRTPDTPLRQEVSRVLRDIRSGKVRADALRDFAARTAEPLVVNIIAGIIQAERSGASLGPMLSAQAQQLRAQRFQRAEKQAMEAPIKLLAPLFTFMFPTTFVVLGFLMVSKAIREGVLTWAPIVWAYEWPGVKG